MYQEQHQGQQQHQLQYHLLQLLHLIKVAQFDCVGPVGRFSHPSTKLERGPYW